MGRGRAKAKQTKVARKLKYSTGHTDLSRLAEELGASPGADDGVDGVDGVDDVGSTEDAADQGGDDDLIAKYADFADDDGARRH